MATTTKQINLAQLDKELGSKGLICDFNEAAKKVILPIESSDVTESQLEAAIAAHVAVDLSAAKESAQAKLKALGLTAEEIEAILPTPKPLDL
jgi:hypothetical protein